MVCEKYKLFYNIVLSQVISECGEFLFVGTNFGDILVFSIPQISSDSFSNGANQSAPRPLQIFHASDNVKISSLEFYQSTLIVGTTVVTGYEWYKNRLHKKSWEVRIASGNANSVNQPNDINCMCVVNDQLYCGSGDSNVYLINLEDGKVLRSFEGHSDYIHGIHTFEDQLYSASQDGTIRIWDKKQKQMANVLTPYLDAKLARPNFGKWQGSVSVNNDWVLCGGGPRPALYHLRSLQCSIIYPCSMRVHVTGFVDDNLFIAGDDKKFNVFNINGDLDAELSSSPSTIYSVVKQSTPTAFVSIGGTSNHLDLCSSLKFKNSSLKLYD